MKTSEETLKLSGAYIPVRTREVKEVKFLLENGAEIEYSKSDNWVTINGKVYNGFSKRDIEQIMCDDYESKNAVPLYKDLFLNKVYKVTNGEEVRKQMNERKITGVSISRSLENTTKHRYQYQYINQMLRGASSINETLRQYLADNGFKVEYSISNC